MTRAEGIGKASVEQACEAGALFIRKASISAVGTWVLKIDLFMGNVEIAAGNNRFILS